MAILTNFLEDARLQARLLLNRETHPGAREGGGRVSDIVLRWMPWASRVLGLDGRQ